MALPTPWEEALFRGVFHKHSLVLAPLVMPLILLVLILKVATLSFFMKGLKDIHQAQSTAIAIPTAHQGFLVVVK